MGEVATREDITIGETDWGQISKDPMLFECGVDNGVVEVTDLENKVQKITFKKGGVMEMWKDETALHIAWEDSDTV